MGDRFGIFRTIPAWDIENERFFKETILAAFDEKLKTSFDLPYHIRELEEMDLSLDNWQLPSIPGYGSWSGIPWVRHPLTAHESLCIYGVVSLSERLPARKLTFAKGAHAAMIIGRQELTALQGYETALEAIRNCHDKEWLQETFGKIENLRMEGYFQEPYIFKPQDFVSIGVFYVPGIDPGELKLMGYVAETVGKSIA